jgi:hypothetical protein
MSGEGKDSIETGTAATVDRRQFMGTALGTAAGIGAALATTAAGAQQPPPAAGPRAAAGAA